MAIELPKFQKEICPMRVIRGLAKSIHLSMHRDRWLVGWQVIETYFTFDQLIDNIGIRTCR